MREKKDWLVKRDLQTAWLYLDISKENNLDKTWLYIYVHLLFLLHFLGKNEDTNKEQTIQL